MIRRVVDWRPLAEALAAHVQGLGYLTNPLLYSAFAETPRHLFVPAFRDYSQPGRWVTDTDEDWLSTVYADEPLVTQVKRLADDAESEWPTCSSSMPSLMADMIEELDVMPGVDVLEVGTGTGYNAAILCHLLGDRQVTTIDVDPDLTREARDRLARLGHHPTYVASERAYDRVLVTHAVTDIPYDWVRWCKPGGMILVDLRSQEHNQTGAWAKLTVSDDGQTAHGHLLASRGSFMGARHTPEFAETGYRPPVLTEEEIQHQAEHMRKRDTNLAPDVLDSPDFGLLVWRAIPGVFWWRTDNQYGMHAPGGCWAHVTSAGTVFHGGPNDLWATVEHAYAQWDAAGRPGLDAWRVTVSASGKTTLNFDDPKPPE